MIDAHFHRNGYPAFLGSPGRDEARPSPAVQLGRDGLRPVHGRETPFHGFHPWQASEDCDLAAVRARLLADPSSGVGEIGLDRLRAKTVSDAQCELFARQLELAAELHRPVVLHGAKCWGEVVAACRPFKGRIPAFLFHDFSRSAGLLPEIFSLNGYISVGPALLNDHAVNYRELVRDLPPERTLLETDMDYAADGDGAERTLRALHAALAALRGIDAATLSEQLDGTAALFLQCLGLTGHRRPTCPSSQRGWP